MRMCSHFQYKTRSEAKFYFALSENAQWFAFSSAELAPVGISHMLTNANAVVRLLNYPTSPINSLKCLAQRKPFFRPGFRILHAQIFQMTGQKPVIFNQYIESQFH